MSEPSAVVRDPARLAALDDLHILDTPPEPGFDDIVALACTLCQAPVALVSLVAGDRQWFKARIGFEASETPLEQSVCAHALAERQPLVITDLRLDDRTRGNPLVTGKPFIRFYAGAPLVVSGQAVGSLCVIDTAPRPSGLTAPQAAGLEALARQVVRLMETRRLLASRDEALIRARTSGLATLQRAIVSETEGKLLRDAEVRATAAQEAGRVGLFEIDLATKTLQCSAELCRIYGLPTRPAYPSSQFTDCLIDEDRERGWAFGADSVDTIELNVELRIRRVNDGAIRWIERSGEFIRDDSGRVTSFVGTVVDITDRKVVALRQAALLRLGDELRDATTAPAIKTAAARIVGTTLNPSRVGYAIVDTAAATFNVEVDWVASGIASIAGLYPISRFANTIAQLSGGAVMSLPDIGDADWLGEDVQGYLGIGTRAQIKIPLLERGRLVGSMFVHNALPRVWSQSEQDFVRAVADRTHAALAKVQAEDEQRILNQELSHRLKNTLAMVQAIAAQTLRGVADRDAVDAFISRLIALSKAHDVLLQQSWAAARIKSVVQGTLSLHAADARFAVEGPDINLGPKAVLSLTLLLHELATNAIKHGALSVPEGSIDLAWEIAHADDPPTLTLTWRETGGPAAVEPARSGFGSRLIRMGLSGTRDADLRYCSDGLFAEFRAPLSLVTEN